LDNLSKIDLSLPINSVVVKKVDYGYFLELKPFGIPALLHRSKIPKEKTYVIGENLQIYIDTVEEVKMRVSVRLAVFDEISRLDFKTPINSVVINEIEFGYFVELEPFGVRALLHRSNIPDGKIFSKGEIVETYIDTVDKLNMKVSVKLALS
jgi:DNA-directed RNA polymerase subunit E'/Rpb7